jgi:hypothetical protein
MKKDKYTTSNSRRDFLRETVTTSAAAAMVAGLPQAAVAEPTEDVQAKDPERGSSGYHVTQHVIDYYRTARS